MILGEDPKHVSALALVLVLILVLVLVLARRPEEEFGSHLRRRSEIAYFHCKNLDFRKNVGKIH